jgi:hypothetical protein
MASPNKDKRPPLTWGIRLDRVRQIRWSNRAVYHLQSLPGGWDPTSDDGEGKGIFELANFIWAMLEGADRLPRPEDVSDVLPLGDAAAIAEIQATITEAIAHAKKGTEEKNGSTGPSLTPGSSVG